MMKELIDLMNRRPAMNAGLVQEYAAWNAECYGVMEALSKTLANEDQAPEAADLPAGQKPRTPGSFVNAAGIHASDKPATVVRKLDAAFHEAVTFADTSAHAQEDAPIVWPKSRDVGRIGDMSTSASLRVGLDGDNDTYVNVWDENGGGSIEFCTPGAGGGKSSRTRVALLALMVAMEADNAEDPRRDWWAARAAQGGAKP